MLIKSIFFVACSLMPLVLCRSTINPVIYPIDNIPTMQCDKTILFEDAKRINVLSKIASLLNTKAYSCRDIYNSNPTSPSGYYTIHTSNGAEISIYCYMEGTNCGGDGGWMRVAYTNMTETLASCPVGLEQRSIHGINLCGRFAPTRGCSSAFYSTFNISYTQVCGRIAGYQYASPGAFQPLYYSPNTPIDDVYVDGISITYGSRPRKHIWTYAAGADVSQGNIHVCPCAGGPSPPSYVGNDYYCESGSATTSYSLNTLYSSDVLWDGSQCDGNEATCCDSPKQPWFLKTLSATTSDNVELRDCYDQSFPDEDTLLFLIELYVR